MSLPNTLRLLHQTPARSPWLDLPLSERPVIYVAGYYSANPTHGTANAIKAFRPLLDMGWVPFIPHTSLLLDIVAPNTPEFWYEYDLAMLRLCKAMYVCNDKITERSTGVSREITKANYWGIPTFSSFEALREWMVARHVI